MPCLLVLLAVLLPRVVMFFIWLLTDWFTRAFEGAWILPLLGFFFMPYTTLAYTWAMISRGVLTLPWILLLIIAVAADISHWGGGFTLRRRRRRRRVV